MDDRRYLALGLALRGAHAVRAAGQATLAPARLAARAPIIGPPLHRAADGLVLEGRLAQAQARGRLEVIADQLLGAPEVEREFDRLLAGPLTDAIARSLAAHRVVERVAAQVLTSPDLDRVIGSALDHQAMERVVARALASPGLERLLIQALESQVTEHVLRSPELERIVEHFATSPLVIDAISHHSRTLAEEMVVDVRARTHNLDDAAERTVRSWLHRPRPRPRPGTP